MRRNLLRSNSTSAERRVYEVLKQLHIPFKHRWIVDGLEIDFLIGDMALEIDGHIQKVNRNHKILELGFTPIHLSNEATKNPFYLKELLLNL
jgi:hypothetical protein